MNFLVPAAFAFAATIPVVILFYLLKRKRVVRLVSSTVLWQRFLAETQASAPFQRLRHNWLLILQVLVLVLAVLALARPYFAGRVAGGRLQVVILDGSASMQSTDEAPSRFAKAQAEALKLVDSLRDTDEMILLEAGAHAEVRQSVTSEKAALRRAIATCRVTDSGTHLTEALKMAESLTRDNNDAEVHLFSDGAASGLKELQDKGLRLVYHRVGKTANNLGVVSLDVRPSPENPNQRAVFASVANYAGQVKRAELELSFDDLLLETKSLSVPASNSVPVVYLVNQARDGVFTVRLTSQDDLAVDDQASIVSLLPQTVKILLVTRGNQLLEKALRVAGRVQLSVSSALAEDTPPFDLVVLDGVMPAVWPKLNVLAFQTMPTNWLEVTGPVDAPPIVDWKGTHPLMRYVSLDNVQIVKALVVKTPTWAVPLIESPQTPLVLAGELGPQRVVWVGFDVLESNWPLRVSFPIFIANAVDWLNPASIRASELLVKAGEPFRLTLNEPAAAVTVTRPNGEQRAVALDPGRREFVFGDTTRRGLYRVTLGTNQVTFAVNLLDSAESNTGPRDELDFGRFGQVKANTTRRASLELWRWIAASGLAALLFEWWYYHRRTA